MKSLGVASAPYDIDLEKKMEIINELFPKARDIWRPRGYPSSQDGGGCCRRKEDENEKSCIFGYYSTRPDENHRRSNTAS